MYCRHRRFTAAPGRHVTAVRDPGLDGHEWHTEWEGLEPLLADSPVEALPELDGLVEWRLVAHGYPIDEGPESRRPRPRS